MATIETIQPSVLCTMELYRPLERWPGDDASLDIGLCGGEAGLLLGTGEERAVVLLEAWRKRC